jgi:SNF2 family DNA or RNA helicase
MARFCCFFALVVFLVVISLRSPKWHALTHYSPPSPVNTHAKKKFKVLRPFLLRRVKSDKRIIQDLPDKVEQKVFCNLTPEQAALYQTVTEYVREEFNRAEALENDKRAGTVGFALTILQRRLASSPEAIYQSLHRRRERLEGRLRELELCEGRHGAVRHGADGCRLLD